MMARRTALLGSGASVAGWSEKDSSRLDEVELCREWLGCGGGGVLRGSGVPCGGGGAVRDGELSWGAGYETGI